MIDRAAFAVGALAVLLALVGGYAWQSVRASAEVRLAKQAGGEVSAAVSVVSPEQKAEALRLIDEAVRAKYEGRTNEALRIAQRARAVDPSVRGVDILAGEIAIESPDLEKRREALLAANRALDRGEDTAGARLILALGTWQEHDGESVAGFTAKTRALRRIEEAADEHPSEPALHFFWSEILATFGKYRDVHRRMLTAMHCAQPWHSYALIARKASFASRDAEAGQTLSGSSVSHRQNTRSFDPLEPGAFLTARQWELVRAELQESPQPGPAEN